MPRRANLVVTVALGATVFACGGAAGAPLPPPAAKVTVLPEVNAAPPVGIVTTTQPPTTTSLPNSQTYTVDSGDTLSGIARRYSTTVSMLLALNAFPNPDALAVGQRIVVPAPPSTTTTTTAGSASGQGGAVTGQGATEGGGATPSVTTSPAATGSTLPAATEKG